MKRCVPVLVVGYLLILTLPGRAEPEAPPKVPDAIKVPEGSVLLARVDAEGVQIYVSKEGKDGKPEWTPKAPLADLSEKGKPFGYHYAVAGPAWEATDGSRVTRDGGPEAVASADAPNPKADIPWLRIKVKADDKNGLLSKAVYVQRLETQGGQPPAQPPVRVGTEVGVKYKAAYYFYGPVK